MQLVMVANEFLVGIITETDCVVVTIRPLAS
jgi:hypothetical protein